MLPNNTDHLTDEHTVLLPAGHQKASVKIVETLVLSWSHASFLSVFRLRVSETFDAQSVHSSQFPGKRQRSPGDQICAGHPNRCLFHLVKHFRQHAAANSCRPYLVTEASISSFAAVPSCTSRRCIRFPPLRQHIPHLRRHLLRHVSNTNNKPIE